MTHLKVKKIGVICSIMNEKEAKSQRLMLISKWRSSSRRPLSRERPKTPDIPPDSPTKNAQRNSKTREYLIPIANESTGLIEKQPLLLVDDKE